MDGKVVYKLQKTALGADAANWPNEEMYFILNNGQRSAAPDSTTVWPNYLRIDYVSIYKWGG